MAKIAETPQKHTARKSAVVRSDKKIDSPSPVVIEHVQPQVDEGLFSVKKSVGERVNVTASIHCHGHNQINAQILFKKQRQEKWSTKRMCLAESGLDLWSGHFRIEDLEPYEFTLEAWINVFGNWRIDTGKKIDADQIVSVDLEEGVELLLTAATSAVSGDAPKLKKYAATLKAAAKETGPLSSQVALEILALIADEDLEMLMFKYAPRGKVCQYEKRISILVEPERALYGAWYEMFPRSASDQPGVHGTFKDVIARLPYIANMGFDVLYLPPLHPIGKTARKGPNNSLTARPNDVGSPWAIGGEGGGHKSIHQELGTLKDFDQLVAKAKKYKIDIAIDIAYQCSPDHPYAKEHPEWFYHRADGSIRCAENPPKKYEDIYPLNFEGRNWRGLWEELKEVIDFWIDHGVQIFRIDNPHTKPYAFWQFLISEVKKHCPEAIFLAEAFTRPKVMKYLAKVGFSQSYTYFTWRLGKEELTDYFNELYHTDVVNYLRPNLFVNTPDILTHFLQNGGRPAFMIRLALAATIGASYGIYGPPFELCIGDSLNNTEEYYDSEKYQLRHWNLEQESSIADFVRRINRIRRENAALHNNESLRFLTIDNNYLLAYVKRSLDEDVTILTIVNLDPYNAHDGRIEVPLDQLGLSASYEAHDLITNARYLWSEWNYVRLDPQICPVHILRLVNSDNS